MSVTAAAPSGRKTRDGLARALRRNGIPRDPDLNQPLPEAAADKQAVLAERRHDARVRTMLVLLYQQVVPDREVPGGTLPGLGTEAMPIAVKYARDHGDPAVPALPVGRPVPATALLGMADDLRLGCVRRDLRLGADQHLGGRSPEHHRRR